MYYVYKFKDKKGKIIYIGKTRNIDTRMQQHFGTKGHLVSEAYACVKTIEYIQLPSKIDMDIKELYFINKYKPEYNKVNKQEESITLKIEESDEWKIYKNKKERQIEQLKSENQKMKLKMSKMRDVLRENKEEIAALRNALGEKEEDKRQIKDKICFEVIRTPDVHTNEVSYSLTEVKALLKWNRNIAFSATAFVNGKERYRYVVYWEEGRLMARDMLESKEIILEEQNGQFVMNTVSEQMLMNCLDFLPDLENRQAVKKESERVKEADRIKKEKISLLRSIKRPLEDIVYEKYNREGADELMEYLWDNKEKGDADSLTLEWLKVKECALS